MATPGIITEKTLLFTGLVAGAFAVGAYYDRLCKRNVVRVPVILYHDTNAEEEYEAFYRGLTYLDTGDVLDYDFYLFTDILTFRQAYQDCIAEHKYDNKYNLIICRIPDQVFATWLGTLGVRVISVMSPYFPGHDYVLLNSNVLQPSRDKFLPDIKSQNAQRVLVVCTGSEHVTFPDENISTLVMPKDGYWLEILHKFTRTCGTEQFNTICIFEHEWKYRKQELALVHIDYPKIIKLKVPMYEDGKKLSRTCISVLRGLGAKELVDSSDTLMIQ